MQLQHEFTLPIPPDRAWATLLDVERVAPCMPGATLDHVDGDEFTGRMALKMGPLRLTYRGAARIQERDEAARRLVIAADGQEARGSGSAQATVTAALSDNDGGTRVDLTTDLALTGRPAQFGRGLVSDVAGTIVGQFADRLADEMTRDGTQDQVLADAPQATQAGDDGARTRTDHGPRRQASASGYGRPAAEPSGDASSASAGVAAAENSLDVVTLLRSAIGTRGALALAGAAGVVLAFALGRASRRRTSPIGGHPGGWPAVVVVDAGEK